MKILKFALQNNYFGFNGEVKQQYQEQLPGKNLHPSSTPHTCLPFSGDTTT